MTELMEKISEIDSAYSEKIKNAGNINSLDEIYIQLFSKKHGIVTELMKGLTSLTIEEKKLQGPELNKLLATLKDMIDNKKSELANEKLNDPLVDLSYPEKPLDAGMLHPPLK